MPAMPQPDKINGRIDGKLEALREKARTRFLNDPEALKKLRARGKKQARKTLLERKIITELEIEEAEKN